MRNPKRSSGMRPAKIILDEFASKMPSDPDWLQAVAELYQLAQHQDAIIRDYEEMQMDAQKQKKDDGHV